MRAKLYRLFVPPWFRRRRRADPRIAEHVNCRCVPLTDWQDRIAETPMIYLAPNEACWYETSDPVTSECIHPRELDPTVETEWMNAYKEIVDALKSKWPGARIYLVDNPTREDRTPPLPDAAGLIGPVLDDEED